MVNILMNFINRRAEAEAAKRAAMARAMEMIGLQMEGYAKEELTRQHAVDTGRLRNSITHSSSEEDAVVGTNVQYSP